MYHIIINPASRSGRGLKLWKEAIEPLLHERQVIYRSYFSRTEGDVAKLAAEISANAAERPLRLIILGGDGTVNEALQGLSDLSNTIIGYIPTGSSNDFARDLKIPKNPTAALDMILSEGQVRKMDLGLVESGTGEKRYFAGSCGIGFDAAVCEEILHSPMKAVLNKLGLGKLTYVAIALKQLLTSKKYPCKLVLDDNKPVYLKKLFFTACMLHRFEGGGFMFCPDADHGDGIIDLCVVGDVSRLKVLMAIPLAQIGKHFLFKGVTPYRAKQIQIKTEQPLWLHTDGEVICKTDSITVSCTRQALHFICPKQ